MSDSLNTIKDVAVEAVTEAGKILISYFGRVKDIHVKDHAGLVTEADKKAEDKIISIIRKHYPNHAILAEESGKHEKDSPFCWVIDPLDGTTNYVHEIPFFCSSIGVQRDGVTVVGVVLDPIHHGLYTAIKEKGAFKNGQRLSVSKKKSLEGSLIATGFAYQKGDILDKSIEILRPFMEITRGIRRCGSAVWDLCQVAEGHFDGFWERGLQPWDVAAGILFIEEAGGKVTNFKGGPTSINDRQLIASNGQIHERMTEIVSRF